MITIFRTFFVVMPKFYFLSLMFNILYKSNMITETPNTIEVKARTVSCSSTANSAKLKVVTIVNTNR